MTLVTKHVVNACPRSAILVVHFIVGAVAVLKAKLGTRRSISVYRAKHLKTRLGSSFTVRISA